MKSLFIFMIFLGAALSVNATDVVSAKVVDVRSGSWYGQKVLFKVSPAPVFAEGACNSLGDLGHYVIDLEKPGSEAWLSLVLMAKASNADIQVWGTNGCLPINGMEGEELSTIAVK